MQLNQLELISNIVGLLILAFFLGYFIRSFRWPWQKNSKIEPKIKITFTTEELVCYTDAVWKSLCSIGTFPDYGLAKLNDKLRAKPDGYLILTPDEVDTLISAVKLYRLKIGSHAKRASQLDKLTADLNEAISNVSRETSEELDGGLKSIAPVQ